MDLPQRVLMKANYVLVTKRIKESKAAVDDPEGAHAPRAASRTFADLSRISSASGVSAMSRLTAFSIFPAVTTSSAPPHSLTTTPTFSTSVTSCALAGWSECSGQVASGTPRLKLSMQEFHPQWLRNPPTAPWLKISSCGAHPLTTRPDPRTRCSNPSGKWISGRVPFLKILPRSAARRTQRNLLPLCSSPAASSAT
ncbi:hypothetical protein EJ110_NYTH03634 [Nymphaea thermarum]|nr:hypothetical protein EJ110_NYTH03634 [Nymphaea thermarum]